MCKKYAIWREKATNLLRGEMRDKACGRAAQAPYKNQHYRLALLLLDKAVMHDCGRSSPGH